MSRSSEAPTAKRHLAEEAARRLIDLEGVLGVLLYGSVARGDATDLSDIDLMVLKSSRFDHQDYIDQLPKLLRNPSLSIQVHSPDELANNLDRSPLFALHLRHEGVVLYDPASEITTLLSVDRPVLLDSELAAQRKNLALYSDVNRFGDALLVPLARVYSIGRAVVFLRLWEHSIVEFDSRRAFDKLAEVEPRWLEALRTIYALKSFYQAVRTDTAIESVDLEDADPVGGRERLRRAVAAVQALLVKSEGSE